MILIYAIIHEIKILMELIEVLVFPLFVLHAMETHILNVLSDLEPIPSLLQGKAEIQFVEMDLLRLQLEKHEMTVTLMTMMVAHLLVLSSLTGHEIIRAQMHPPYEPEPVFLETITDTMNEMMATEPTETVETPPVKLKEAGCELMVRTLCLILAVNYEETG